MQNYIHSFDSESHDPLVAFLTHASKTTSRFIKENPDVIVVQSDKGKKTVLMYEKDYDEKMQSLLSDTDTYERSRSNPTADYRKENDELVNRLLNLELITKEEAAKLFSRSPYCPRIYGLPKAHKPEIPLRPVVPSMTSPSYMLSKYVADILKQAICSEFNVKDSFSFCRFINSVQLPADHVLVSFDVVSLFTCIPRDLVRRAVIMNWGKIEPFTRINLDLFIELVEFVLRCSYFCYRGKYYKQVFSTAMGNPFSSTAADLVMELLLEDVVQRLDFPVPLLKKYVDDLILALPAHQVDTVLQVFNSYDSHIQFTCEIERDGRIPYLDMVLVRQPDQTIKTEWYSKPMASGRFLDFLSCHPLHMKLNMVTNFMRRVQEFSTNLSQKQINHIIDEHLKINHYPISLRHRLLCRIKHGATQQSRETEDIGTTVQYMPMLYVGGLTCRLKKMLRNDFPNLTLACRNEKTVDVFFTNTKDKTPPGMKRNVIYKIPCGECEACYVGMTTQELRQRMYGHNSDRNKLDRLMQAMDVNNTAVSFELEHLKQKTAVLTHSVDHQHKFAYNSTVILDQHRRSSALSVLEMCHIKTTSGTVNKRTDVENLSSSYAGIINTMKKKKQKHRTLPTQTNNTVIQSTQSSQNGQND